MSHDYTVNVIFHLKCKPSKKTKDSDVELVAPGSALDRRNSSNNPDSMGNMKGVHASSPEVSRTE